MSKMIAALPQLRIKESMIGGALSLVVYVVLQFLNAALIDCRVLGEESLYAAVCISAGVSAFAGCGYSVLQRGRGAALSAASVVVVFLLLTVVVGILSGGECTGSGLVGVGGSMAVGGLAAAVAGSSVSERKRGRRESVSGKRKRK